jgi:hypothetical protein
MRLIELSCDRSSFHTVPFNREGLSLIVGDGSKDKTKEGSSNGVGKTLTVDDAPRSTLSINITAALFLLSHPIIFSTYLVVELLHRVRAVPFMPCCFYSGSPPALSSWNPRRRRARSLRQRSRARGASE